MSGQTAIQFVAASNAYQGPDGPVAVNASYVASAPQAGRITISSNAFYANGYSNVQASGNADGSVTLTADGALYDWRAGHQDTDFAGAAFTVTIYPDGRASYHVADARDSLDSGAILTPVVQQGTSIQ